MDVEFKAISSDFYPSLRVQVRFFCLFCEGTEKP